MLTKKEKDVRNTSPLELSADGSASSTFDVAETDRKSIGKLDYHVAFSYKTDDGFSLANCIVKSEPVNDPIQLVLIRDEINKMLPEGAEDLVLLSIQRLPL